MEARPPATHVPEEAIEAALAKLGHSTFRTGQREAIDTLLQEKGLLMVAPTGGGKSLCYQLPALLLGGTTLVISPLISLMRDQVAALEERGISATFLASTLSDAEISQRLRNISESRYQLAYVAPERLATPDFADLLSRLECPLVAVDEAHCISEWGHDFRPDYMQIGRVLDQLKQARVLACTATATPVVRDEIIERLGLASDTPQLVKGFARPNLALRVHEVRNKKEREAWVDEALAESLGRPGEKAGAAIVYAPTRRTTEAESERLAARGWHTLAYHAGLEAEFREDAHAAFSSGELEVVVATNAFGMGIDRADVRAVVHLAPPGSIEAYYQEVGRAGRDGEDAIGLMLVSPGDMARRRFLTQSDDLGDESESEAARHRWALFLELMRFAEGGSCRHDAVLRYFGDEEETLAGCGRCDVCLRLASGTDASEDYDPDQVSLVVRKALSGVARIHGRYGLSAAVALLRGASDVRLERRDLHRTSTFGILDQFEEDWITRLLRRCITAGWVDFFGGEKPVVALTEEGIAVMQGERPVRLLLPPLKKTGQPRRRTASPRAIAPSDQLEPEDHVLFEALRNHRLEIARQQRIPPYRVASDRALRDIARLRPTDTVNLQLANGIGPNKAELYGEGLIQVVLAHPRT
ncbi:MAG: ATP-dependent DNA helicase RecQ [Myxococcota bacterium]|nr:ATP-dependent DNA helicase RecQ [Myxococcota bacterium]